MKYALVVQSEELARNDAPPFIPDRMLLQGLWGIKVFGPYKSTKDASDALRKFPANEGWSISVQPMNELSEAMDNPYAYICMGDSPDE